MLVGCCAAVIFFACLPGVQGLTCYSCSDIDFNGEPDYKGSCFNVINTTSTSTSSEDSAYCITGFIFEDGMVRNVLRSLALSGSIIPTDTCQTTIQLPHPSNAETSVCYYYCNSTEKCNDKGISSLKICKTNCGRPSRGYCDFITGACSCRNGYSGDDCSIPPSISKRKCVQCNSETDSNCQTQTVGSDCPGTERYCSTAQTSVFTPTELVRKSIIRGCTSTHVAVDECRFTDIYSELSTRLPNTEYREFTCYSTCDKDSCNINTPDGIINEDEKALMCEQCTSESGDCRVGRSICPTGSRYCKAKVTYVLSDSNDKSYKALSSSDYKILSVVRECATEPVTKGCTESKVDEALSFKKVTCEETCQEDGCNVGWPARPKCIQCSSASSSCLKDPESAHQCPHPFEKYCYIYNSGMDKSTGESVDGYPRALVRGCSYIDRGTGCSTVILRDKKIQTCNYTCSTDGCNVGIYVAESGSHSATSAAYYRLAILIVVSSTLLFNFSL